jgi:hypothetical protein
MTKGFKEIKLEEKKGLKIISMKFNDVLDKEDYDLFVPQLEGLFKDNDKIRFLIELEEFKGFTPGALWEEAKFSFKHFRDIDRLAVVGDNKIEKIVTGIAKPFTKAEVRFFHTSKIEEAKKWLYEQV